MDKCEAYKQNKEEAVCDKLLRECGLLASMAEKLPAGEMNAVDDAFKHSEQSALIVGVSAATGLGLAVLSKNPGIAGKAVEPLIRFGLKATPVIGGVAVSHDLGMRLREPIMATWNSPLNYDSNKTLLASKLGTATVDYTLMGLGGFAGAKYAPGALGKIACKFGELTKSPNDLRFAYAADALGHMDTNVLNPKLKSVEENEHVLLMKGPSFDNFSRISIKGRIKIGSNPSSEIPSSPPEEGNVILYPHSSNKYVVAKIFAHGKWQPLDLLKILNKKDTKFSDNGSAEMESLAQTLQKMEGTNLVSRERPSTNPSVTPFKHFTLENPIVPELPISGEVTIDRSNLKPAQPAKGDVYIGIVLKGDRTSAGQPGYIYTEIFDGNSWHSLKVRKFQGDSKWEFDGKSVRDLEATARSIKEHLMTARNKTVNWTEGSKKFDYR